MYEINQQLAGDLILLKSSKIGKLNRAYQSLIRGRKADFSHVAIALDHLTALHAIPSGGVQQIEISELLKGKDVVSYRVLRNKKFELDISLHQTIRQNLLFHHGQMYNLAFNFRRLERSSYCSELAAKAYSRTGIPLSSKQPKQVLPVDIQQLGESKEWLDVTSVYLQTLSDENTVESDPELQKFFENSNATMHEAALFQMEIEATLHEGALNQHATLRLLNEIERVFDIPKLELPEQANEYWNVPSMKKHQRGE